MVKGEEIAVQVERVEVLDIARLLLDPGVILEVVDALAVMFPWMRIAELQEVRISTVRKLSWS